IVCRHMPPAPGCHFGPESWPRSPASSCQDLPPSVERNNAASSTPAYTVSGSFSEGSRCHTRLNSQGCWVPSYHWWVVSGRPLPSEVSYTNLLLSPFGNTGPSGAPSDTPSGGFAGSSCPFPEAGCSHVLPPSLERWITWPNQSLVWEA